VWIKVDSSRNGVATYVASEHIERCDVNPGPQAPFAALTMVSGVVCYISEEASMKRLQRALGQDLPRA
jgi:hypothetical protein